MEGSYRLLNSHFKPDGYDSEDELVTKVEKEKFNGDGHEVIITDIFRKVEKFITSRNLEELLFLGKNALGYSDDEVVYAVLEEDGTEIDEDEYFQLLPEKTTLMILSGHENWSPSIGFQGRVLFDSSSTLSSSQIASALLEHIQAASLEHSQDQANYADMEEDDFPVQIVTQTQNTAF